MALTSLVFLLGFFGGCLLAFARHPIYGLCTYVALFYLHPPSRWWGESLPDLRWALVAAVVTTLALIVKNRREGGRHNIPLLRHRVMVGLLLFLGWIAIQFSWALDIDRHTDLFILFAKYSLLIALIYKCIDSVEHLRLFLWTHVGGCFYLGWLAYTTYSGGRFEGFGGPGINEANAAALQVVTGLLVAGTLFLEGKWREKGILIGLLPFIVNALVTTISRSGFLAAAISGIVFNLFAPKPSRTLVKVLSALGIALFLLLTNDTYWARIASITELGAEVEGVDTGANRLILIDAQWRMFEQYPMGCGHRCTATLSPLFLEERYLTSAGGRSSHNTFMTMTVEHGIPGMALYILLLAWLAKSVISLSRHYLTRQDLPAYLFPSVAAALAAVTVGDLFVDYLISEVRIWFIALLMVLVRMALAEKSEQSRVASGNSQGTIPRPPNMVRRKSGLADDPSIPGSAVRRSGPDRRSGTNS